MEQLLLTKCDSAMQPGFGKGKFEVVGCGRVALKYQSGCPEVLNVSQVLIATNRFQTLAVRKRGRKRVDGKGITIQPLTPCFDAN